MKKENKIIVYQAKNGAIELRSNVDEDTVWANKKQIADIFRIDRSVVSRHIKNIFQDKELNQKVVCAEFAHTTKHGAIRGKTQTNKIEYYNLDIILAVGYRTKSSVAVEFRKWATQTLKEHITKGFTINPKRIKQNLVLPISLFAFSPFNIHIDFAFMIYMKNILQNLIKTYFCINAIIN